MKKLFENKWFDHIAKGLITLLMGWLVYMMVDIRDNNKYRQPYIDTIQNQTMEGLSTKLAETCSLQNEKNNVVHKRIDKTEDRVQTTENKLNTIDRKIDLILYHMTGKPVINDELTQN